VTLQVAGAVARSDVGHVREGNEDSAYAGSHLLAVADGMGGHAAGEVASSVTIAAVARLDDDVPGTDLLAALQEAVEDANATIREMVEAEPDLAGMGTTLTAILASGQRIGLVHVGDSRAYLLRDGRLTQITHDHTYVQDLVDAGQITAEEAAHHPRRSLLLRALDGRPETEIDLRMREARAGDRYLLCSDGLSGVVSDATIAECLNRPSADDAAQALVELALRAGGPDNVTVVVADLTDSPDGDAATVVPQVAGAAALNPAVRGRGHLLTAAGRAALVRPRRRKAEAVAVEPPRRRRWIRRTLLGVVVVVILLAAVAVGGRMYLDRQWFVSAQNGQVVVEQGIPGSVAGWQLHHVKDHITVDGKPLLVSDLNDGAARDVAQHTLTASSRADANALAQRLGRKDSDGITVLPTPPSPTPTPSPTPAAP
jgi:protein phosphatase